jgi:hypothetical protein
MRCTALWLAAQLVLQAPQAQPFAVHMVVAVGSKEVLKECIH